VDVDVAAVVDATAAMEVAAELPILTLRSSLLLLYMMEASSREVYYEDMVIHKALVAECLVPAT
jgi:hypothetical protein